MNKPLRFIFGIALFACTAPWAGAETVKYPEKGPLFSLTVPSGWEAKFENGALKLIPEGSAMVIVQRVDSISDEATAREAVPELAQMVGTQFGLSGMRISTHVREMTAGQFKGFMTDGIGQGKSGQETVWQVFLFAPGEREYFLVTALWEKAEEAKISAERTAIFGSLSAVLGN